MTKYLLYYLILVFVPVTVHAGFFGADNYEDCVLEKMKGQNKLMIRIAQKSCEKKFPYEKELLYYKDNIEINWYSDAYSLNITITENNGDYLISRYKATFATKPCTKISSNNDYTLTKTFRFSGKIQKSSITLNNADQYKCMRTDRVWGLINAN